MAEVEEMVSYKSLAQIMNKILETHPAYYWEFNSGNKGILNILPKSGKAHKINDKPFPEYRVRRFKREIDADAFSTIYVGTMMLQTLKIRPVLPQMTGGVRPLIGGATKYPPKKPSQEIRFDDVAIRDAINELIFLRSPAIWEFYYDRKDKRFTFYDQTGCITCPKF